MKKNQYHIDVTPEEDMLFRDVPVEGDAPVYRHKLLNIPIISGIVAIHLIGAAALFGTSLKKEIENLPVATPTPVTVTATPTPIPAPTPIEKISSTAPTQSPPLASPLKGGEVPLSTNKQTTTYTVKQGDTFYSIVKKYKLNAKTLTELNDIKDPAKIRVGQVLKFVK